MQEQNIKYQGRFKSSEGKMAEIFTTKGEGGSHDIIYTNPVFKKFRGDFGHTMSSSYPAISFVDFISKRNFSFGAIPEKVFENYKKSLKPVGKTLKFVFLNLIEKNK